MRGLRRSWVLVVVMVMVLIPLLAGCGTSKTTGIKGRVIDEAGAGIAEATVLLEQGSQVATTGSDGTYSFVALAEGQYKLMATKELFGPAGFLPQVIPQIASEDSVVVAVKRGQITEAPDIALKPVAGIDTVVIQSASPKAQSSLVAGTRQDVSVSINYNLVSHPTASLIVLVSYVTHEGREGVFAGAERAIGNGKGTIDWSESIYVPHGIQLSYTAIIANGDSLLAYNQLVGPKVTGALVPMVKNLTITPVSDGIKLNWSAVVENLDNLKLIRTESLNDTTREILVFRNGDVIPEEYIDRDVREGIKYDYRLVLTTLDGQTSYRYGQTIMPLRGLTLQPLGSSVSDIALDPVRGLVYAADRAGSQLRIFSADNGLAEADIPLEKQPWRLAIGTDTTWLAVLNQGGRSLTFVDLAARIPYTMETSATVFAFAMHPDGTKAYLSAYTPDQKYVLQEVDIATRTVLHQIELGLDFPTSWFFNDNGYYRPLAVDRDGSRLFVAASVKTAVIDLSTLSATEYLDGTGPIVTVNPTKDELFIGPFVYSTTGSMVRTCTLPSTVMAVNNLGTVYTLNTLGRTRLIRVFQPAALDVYNIKEELAIPESHGDITLMVAGGEGEKLYFVRDATTLGIIDFSLR